MKQIKYIPISTPNPERITNKQVCRILGINRKKLRKLREENKLTMYFTRGGTFYFYRSQVEALLQELTNNNSI